MDAFWPHVVFDKGAFDGYMAKGYDKLHLTLWGSNVSSHQFYYEKAKDVYTYGELKAGKKRSCIFLRQTSNICWGTMGFSN